MDTKAHSSCAHSARAERIARLNDHLRKDAAGGQILVSQGVRALPGFNLGEILQALADHDQFDPCNDPHGERDFGGVDLWGAELLWKVDYYAPDMLFGSDDPADPVVTRRVLTVLLAEEY